MVAGAGILATADNRENAEKFLEFMLSRVGQQYFVGDIFEYPLVDGVTTSRVLVPLAEINQPTITLKDLTDLEGTVRLLRDSWVLPSEYQRGDLRQGGASGGYQAKGSRHW